MENHFSGFHKTEYSLNKEIETFLRSIKFFFSTAFQFYLRLSFCQLYFIKFNAIIFVCMEPSTGAFFLFFFIFILYIHFFLRKRNKVEIKKIKLFLWSIVFLFFSAFQFYLLLSFCQLYFIKLNLIIFVYMEPSTGVFFIVFLVFFFEKNLGGVHLF